ncbi:MAG: hypothetical protein JOZ51_03745 [Chloroflexi bacterium]|nr:hypothetical protein [Chloroflexota bacterium]
MAATTSTVGNSRNVNWSRYALVGIATIVAAVLANLVVYYIGSAIVGYNPDFVVLSTNGGTIIFTLVPAIVAVLLYAILLRFTRQPERIFTIISVIVFIVTLIPDFTYIPSVPGSSNPQTAILVIMHVVAAVVITWMLTKLSRPRAQ